MIKSKKIKNRAGICLKSLVSLSEYWQGALFLLLAGILLILTPGCEKEKQPFKIGFAGGLTGRYSDLGTSGRNGVMLAVEEINKKGGINGRLVKLITKDDRQDPETAIKVDKELIKEGVIAIIGHMTSSMSLAVISLINKAKIIMISPTTSTNKLSGLDDYFIRVIPSSKAETDHLAGYIRKKTGITKVAAVYDSLNRAYAEDYFQNFKMAFENMGGKIIWTKTFKSGDESHFESLAISIINQEPDGILIIANALDTAMICQQIRKTGSKVPIISSGWAMTRDLIHNGGHAVEGIIFSHLINKDSKDPKYLSFKKRFTERFAQEPDFAAIHGYVTANLLFRALSQNPDLKKLKKTILNIKKYDGIVGVFEIDKYGDPKRSRYLMTVKNGRFKTLEYR